MASNYIQRVLLHLINFYFEKEAWSDHIIAIRPYRSEEKTHGNMFLWINYIDKEVFHMKKSPALKFIFVNPNSPATIEAVLKKILLEKLLAEFAYPERLPAAG